jgi:5-formyltetrahydrofolate cyclo-ligase
VTSSMQRSEIRKLIRLRRRSLSVVEQNIASKNLLTILTSHQKIQQAKSIAIYLARDGELNGELFIEWCWQNNKTVYLPVIHPFSKGHLLFLKYQANTLMKMSSLGINEPKLDIRLIKPADQIDIILTPLVAFDATGNRLGMGGGFYDRTLAACLLPSKNNDINLPYPIGIAHDCQQVEQLPIEHWDMPLPEIITPTQVITKSTAR